MKAKLCELEAERMTAETKAQEKLTSLAERHSAETDRLTAENKQLALNICELEESLDKATNKVKQYKVDISALERTLAGEIPSVNLI